MKTNPKYDINLGTFSLEQLSKIILMVRDNRSEAQAGCVSSIPEVRSYNQRMLPKIEAVLEKITRMLSPTGNVGEAIGRLASSGKIES